MFVCQQYGNDCRKVVWQAITYFVRDCVTYLSLLVIQCQRKTGNGQEQGSFLKKILQYEDLVKLASKLTKKLTKCKKDQRGRRVIFNMPRYVFPFVNENLDSSCYLLSQTLLHFFHNFGSGLCSTSLWRTHKNIKIKRNEEKYTITRNLWITSYWGTITYSKHDFHKCKIIFCHLANARAHQKEGRSPIGRDVTPNTWYSCQFSFGRKENSPVPWAIVDK